jgi:thiamine monophosphate kinase
VYCAASGRPWRYYAIGGGEDYGLVFTAPAARRAAIKKLLPAALVVGRVEKGRGAVIENFNGKVKSFEHF